MIRRFVDWYIKRFWKSEFILRDDIGKALLDAKANERERLAKVHAEQMVTLRERMELDKIMAVEELQAQKLQIEAEMEEMVKRVKKAEEVYMKSIRRTKSNSRVANDMAQQAMNLLGLVGQIHGAIEGIKTRALGHLASVEEEDAAERDKLKIPEFLR